MGIMAEVHGKISSAGSNINDRMEDILTSNVFQLLRYLPIEFGILPVLSSAENSHGEDQRRTFVIPKSVNNVSYDFWRIFDNCEPDVFIELKHKDEVLANIIIEAKYLSGKSGSAEHEDEEDGTQTYIAHSDQLEKQWSALKAYSEHTPHYLFYLTMDWVMPIHSIDESIEAIGDDDCRDSIYWLNWQTIHTTLTNILKDNSTAIYEADIIIQDIIDLFDKKGLIEFSGINIPSVSVFKPLNYFNQLFYDDFPNILFAPFQYYYGGHNE